MDVFGRAAEMTSCMAGLGLPGAPAAAVVVTGDPGMGKTTIQRAVLQEARATGWRVLATTAVDGERGGGLEGLHDLLQPMLAEVLERLPGIQRDALEAALVGAQPSPTDLMLIQRSTLSALREVARVPTVLAIDDEQWLDPDTRRLLARCLPRLVDTPLRWILAVRAQNLTDGVAPDLAHALAERYTQVGLGPLDAGAMAHVVRVRFPGTWPRSTLQHLVELAAGNPLTALELARASADDRCRAPRLPRRLSESLVARLEALPPKALSAVQVAAQTARPTRPLLRRVLGPDADPAIDDAIDAEILDLHPPNPVLVFTHPLLREAAAALPKPAIRRRIHRALAGNIDDADEVAAHLAAGAEEPNEHTADLVFAAAARMHRRGAAVRAAALAGAAVALTPSDLSLAKWQRRLFHIDALAVAGEFDEGRRQLRSAGADVPPVLRGEFTARRGEWLAESFEESERLYEAALRELAGTPLRAVQIAIKLAMQQCVISGRLQAARDAAEYALHTAKVMQIPALVRAASAVAGAVDLYAGKPGAEHRLRAAAALPAADGPQHLHVDPNFWLAVRHQWRGEVDQAARYAEASLHAVEQSGLEAARSGTLLLLTELHSQAGRWSAARASAIEYEQFAAGVPHPFLAGAPEYAMALATLVDPDLDAARERLVRGLRAAEAVSNVPFTVHARRLLGHLELSVEDPVAAVRWLEPADRLLALEGYGDPGAYPLLPDLIEAYAKTGQLRRAHERLDSLRGAVRALDHPWARVATGRASGVLALAERDPGGAIGHVECVLAETRDLRLPMELGRSLLVLGTAQRKARRRREAARTLDEASAVFEDLGAARWATLTGTQRDAISAPGGTMLTPTETRIADLVAKGASNLEIARRLLISVKTVEANLTRIYRKLGLRGRVELARRS